MESPCFMPRHSTISCSQRGMKRSTGLPFDWRFQQQRRYPKTWPGDLRMRAASTQLRLWESLKSAFHFSTTLSRKSAKTLSDVLSRLSKFVYWTTMDNPPSPARQVISSSKAQACLMPTSTRGKAEPPRSATGNGFQAVTSPP